MARNDELKQLQELQQMRNMGKWYSWDSPIGLSIFFLTLALLAIAAKITIFGIK